MSFSVKFLDNRWIKLLLFILAILSVFGISLALRQCGGEIYKLFVTNNQIAFTGAVADRYGRLIPDAVLIIQENKNSADSIIGLTDDIGEFKILLPEKYHPRIFLTVKKDDKVIIRQEWDMQPGEQMPTNYP